MKNRMHLSCLFYFILGSITQAQTNVCFNTNVEYSRSSWGLYEESVPVAPIPSKAKGDFNEDGLEDLAVVNHSDESVSIFLATSAGNYAEPNKYIVAIFPGKILVADFNGDGHQDLVTLNFHWGTSDISVLKGDGAGGFEDALIFPIGNAGERTAMAVEDLTGDGLDDLVISQGSSSISVLLSNCAGGFDNAGNFSLGSFDDVTAIVPADFTGDGEIDLVVATASWGFFGDDYTYFHFLRGSGIGWFADPVNFYFVPDDLFSIVSGDFNKDGAVDFATTHFYAKPFVFLNKGDGTFWAPGKVSTALGDFNQDGNMDMVTNYYAGPNRLVIFSGDGQGNLNEMENINIGNEPVKIITADFNNDGFADLATANKASNDVSVLLGNSSGSFDEAIIYKVGSQPQALTTGYFNDDRIIDLAIANTESHDVTVLLGKELGSFTVSTYAVGKVLWGITASDFNGDGSSDLATANSVDHTISVLLNNNAGGFSKAIHYSVLGSGLAETIVATDFNNDSIVDIAVGNSGYSDGWDGGESPSLSIFFGKGSGDFLPAINYSLDWGQSTVLTCEDFNGDGFEDIATPTSVFLNTRSEGFATPTNIGTKGHTLASADFDNNSQPDLVVIGDDLSILLNYNLNLTIHAEGPTTFCADESVILKANLSDGVFSWSPGGTTTNSLEVTTSGTYHVTNTRNGCSLISNSITINVNPLPSKPAEFIESAQHVCINSDANYSVPKDSTITYAWSYSGTGSVITGEGNAVDVRFTDDATSGNLIVTTVNSCGVSDPLMISITVSPAHPEKPDNFTEGPSEVCQGQGSVEYTIPNNSEVTYQWDFSGTGATWLDESSNSVSINFNDESTSGDLSVVSINACGNSEARTLSINVNSKPLVPTISAEWLDTEGPILISSSEIGNQWYSGDGIIPSATGSTLQVNSPGSYSVIVTLNGCNSEPSESFVFVITGTQKSIENGGIFLYPVPAKDHINIRLNEFANGLPASLVVYDQMGRLIETIPANDRQDFTIPLTSYPAGIYFIRIVQGEKFINKRFSKE